jgi:predicted enzyme related to lactoylglutathione lyase
MVVETGAVASALPAGAPCWVELGTGDERRAMEYYAALFGWEYSITQDPTYMTGEYAYAMRDGFAVAGIFRSENPFGWVPHVAVTDTIAGIDRVKQYGGEVTIGPIERPGQDSTVYARDPLGAPLVLRCPPPGWVFTTGAPGTFASADLNTHHGDMADEFYCTIFGYTSERIGNSPDIDYARYLLAGAPVLYRYVMGPEYPATTPAHWLLCFVADPAEGTDATALRALRLGGDIVVQPYDTQLGRFAVLTDSGGAPFALLDPTDSPEARRAPVEDPNDD